MKDDEWRAIAGFDGYEVNRQGDVRSWRKRERSWRNADRVPGRRETPKLLPGTITPFGYRAFILRNGEGKPCRRLAHRLVALAFLGHPPTPEHTDVAHNDGDPSNNHISNLRWATHRENQLDMRRHGTMQDGSRCITAKLSDEDIELIRREVESGPRGTQRRMAERFNVSPSQINRIVKGRRWKWKR